MKITSFFGTYILVWKINENISNKYTLFDLESGNERKRENRARVIEIVLKLEMLLELEAVACSFQ